MSAVPDTEVIAELERRKAKNKPRAERASDRWKGRVASVRRRQAKKATGAPK